MPRDGGATKKAAIRITKVGARALPDADPEMGEGSSDPYVVFILYNEKGREQSKARTRTLLNCSRNPTWPDEVLLSLPQGFAPGSGSLGVEVWDEDTKDADDFMGQVSKPLKLTAEGGNFVGLDVQGHGALHDFKVSFRYVFELPDVEDEAPTEHRPPRPLESYLFNEAFRHTSFMQARRGHEDHEGAQQQETRPWTPRSHRRTGFMAARQQCSSRPDEHRRHCSPPRLAPGPTIPGLRFQRPISALTPRRTSRLGTSMRAPSLGPIPPAVQPGVRIKFAEDPLTANEGHGHAPSSVDVAHAPLALGLAEDPTGSQITANTREQYGLVQHRDAASVHLAAAQRRLRALQRHLEALQVAESDFTECLAARARRQASSSSRA